MNSYRCPHCGRVVSEEDLLDPDYDRDEFGSVLSMPPPKHLEVKTEIDGIMPVTTVRYRRVNPMAFLLVPFTCVWAGCSLSGIYGSQIARHAFDLKLSLFGIPFLIGSLILVSACLFMLFGRRTLTLSAGKGRYFAGVGPFGRTCSFSYNRETQVSSNVTLSRRRGGTAATHSLLLTNAASADSVRVCSGFSEDASIYAAAILRRECARV